MTVLVRDRYVEGRILLRRQCRSFGYLCPDSSDMERGPIRDNLNIH